MKPTDKGRTKTRKEMLLARGHSYCAHPLYRAHIAGLTKIAYELFDLGQDALGDKLLAIAREIPRMTMSHPTPAPGVLQAAALLFRALNIDCCLMGCAAENFYAIPRGTSGIDLPVSNAPPAAQIADKQVMSRFGLRAVRDTNVSPFILHADEGQIECRIADTELLRQALAQSLPADVTGVRINVATPAFLTALKVTSACETRSRRTKDAKDIPRLHIFCNPDLESVRGLLNPEGLAFLANLLNMDFTRAP